MKTLLFPVVILAACALAPCGYSSPESKTPVQTTRPVTTNLVVYTDIAKPKDVDTSHYYARRVSLSICDGLIVECRDGGVYDLFSGLPEAEARKVARDRTAAASTNCAQRAELRERLGKLRIKARTNKVDRVTR